MKNKLLLYMYYFRLQRKLKQLLNFTKFIPELRRAGDELMYMDDPPPEVHITMGALFLLLEEPDRAIEVCVCVLWNVGQIKLRWDLMTTLAKLERICQNWHEFMSMGRFVRVLFYAPDLIHCE